MASVFKPLVAGTLLVILMWLFIIVAFGVLIWYGLYLGSSKKRTPRTTMAFIVGTAALFAIAFQLFLIRNGINFY